METKSGTPYLAFEVKKAAADWELSLRTDRFRKPCDIDAVTISDYWNGDIKKKEALDTLGPKGDDEARDAEYLLSRAFV